MSKVKPQGQPVKDKWSPPTLEEDFKAAEKWWDLTHIFLEWNKEGDCIYPCFRIKPWEADTLEAAKKNKDFHKLEIFSLDLEDMSIRNQWLNKMSWMERTFVQFFKEAFDIRAVQEGYHFSFDIYRIGLPKKKYDEIMAFINQYGLSDIWELIFYIIAKAQDFYTHKVHYTESNYYTKRMRNIGKEVDGAISLIERATKDFRDLPKKETHDELLRINFIFNNKPSIQLTDPVLTTQVVEYFRDGYNDGYYKDWKLQLQVTKFIYEEEKRREQFRFHFAISLYNFLIQTGLIQLKGKPYPNEVIECVYKILEFSLIRIETKSGKEADKIRTVRNWIKDHKLPEITTHEKIEPDLEKLYKYFDKDFIDAAEPVKLANSIKNGLSLCMQFKTPHLQNEIIHLVACLREWQWRVSQQLERGPILDSPLPKQYETLRLFLNTTVSNVPFDKITFQVNDDKKNHVLTDALPIHFIQEAVRRHYKNFREDYETDILQAAIKNGDTPGSFSFKGTGKFNEPEDRFFPKIVNSFFNFLQQEAPPLEKEFKPSDRYYFFIAKALHETGYFRSQYPEDWELKGKVEYWHSLVKK